MVALLFGIALPRYSPLILLRVAVAVAVFVLSYNGGTFDLVGRHELAIAVWWTVLVLAALRLLPSAQPGAAALLTAALLASFTLWTLLSVAWSPSAEASFAEFDRAALYLGVFVLVLLAGGRLTAAAWADGLALGLSGVAVVALLSRFFPHTFAHGSVPELLPGAGARLTFPVDYWNGLGILVALALPLLLRAATAARTALARGAAVAPVPAVVATIYLTSSRGAVAAALVGLVVFAAVTAERWRTFVALAVGGGGSAVAVAVLVHRHALVDGPLGSRSAIDQGRSAAVLIGLTCLFTAVAHGLAAAWRLRRPPAVLGWATVAAVVVVAAAGIALAHPVRRLHEFKQPPAATASPDFIKAHLLSGRGNGRWQFWSSAVDEFRDRPLLGHGAGSYESWWAQHGSIAYFVRDAHSLYLETLGELGIVGLVLLLGAFGCGLVGGMRAALAADPDVRTSGAALAGGFLAYATGAALDWMWELTVVTVTGIACLALLASLGPAARRRFPGGRWVGSAVAVLVLAVVVAEALPLLTELKLRDSEAAVRRRDGKAALSDASDARTLEPWAASPYLQYALVEEARGDLPAATHAIHQAIARSSRDWRLWLVAARLETRSGAIAAGRRSVRRAILLNPRSPIFANVRP